MDLHHAPCANAGFVKGLDDIPRRECQAPIPESLDKANDLDESRVPSAEPAS